jgi:hypothetical protein
MKEKYSDVYCLLYPHLEDVDIVLIDESAIQQAEDLISACQTCSPEAELTLDYLLDSLTGRNPAVTEYLLRRPARCPRCRAEVTEKTPVHFD